ncbi:MAG: repair protein RadC [Myxococcales bacterium]|nr:repair protein RadC [Myxococcales bacterium]
MSLELANLPLAPTAQLGDLELLALALNRSLTSAAALMTRLGGIHGISRAPLDELERARVPGRRARQLWAALELGRRTLLQPIRYGETVDTAARAAEVMRTRLAHREQEELHVIGLDIRTRIVTIFVAAVGNLAEVYVDPRDVFRPLVRENAHRAIVVHNHPSGHPKPSEADRKLTRQLAAAGEIVGIELVDHIIVAHGGIHSFARAGEL